MSEFNLEKYLSVERMKLLEDQKRYKEMIEELEQTNHELIEKNKALYHENSFLRKELEKTNEVLYAVEGNNIRLMKELEEKDEVKQLLADIAVLKKENENLKYWYEKLNQKFGKIEGENKLLLSYQEQNLKLMESNKALVEEVEKLKKQNKELLLQNIELDEWIRDSSNNGKI